MQLAPLRQQLGYFFGKRVKFDAIFSCFSKTLETAELTKACLQSFQVYCVAILHIEVILPDIADVLQIWSTLAGYEEIAEWFEPIRNGEIFWMNNNTRFLDSLWRRANSRNISFTFLTLLNWSLSNQFSWQNQVFKIDWSQLDKNVRIEWFHFG